MAVHLHRARRTDLLADGLAGVLAVPLADPFAQEVVVVPAKGVERWLTQRLAHRLGARPGGDDGVCAGVDFRTPNSLVTLLLGTDRDDPWLPAQLVWPVLAAIDAQLDQPWARALATHLGHGDESPMGRIRAQRRYSVASRLAGLFHSYAGQRPALLAAWESGDDAAPDASWPDGAGGALDSDLRWQPHLWRAIVAGIDAPTPGKRHTDTVARLRSGEDMPDLPVRLSLFGHTRLARTEIELLDALGTHRDVHVWLPHPSPRLWQKLTPALTEPVIPRADDGTGALVGHPLLASLGRDLRELQRGLGAIGHDALAQHAIAQHAFGQEAIGQDAIRQDASEAAATLAAQGPADQLDPTSPTWLQRLQDDLAADRSPGAVAATLASTVRRGAESVDGSIQIHACHGPARQVEVLREVLLGLLADDPTLEPRDILVMCPDIETFAPLIQAAFGLDDLHFDRAAHPAHQLRVQLADRALTATNPLMAVAARLVDLAAGRITARDLLDLAADPPVRRRFAFDESDLEQLGRWVEQAGVRWGLDLRHRGRYGLPDVGDNTWSAGLDRLLLGVTRGGADHAAAGRLPLEDVDSAAIDLAGRLAEFVDRIELIRTSFIGSHSARAWANALREGVDAVTDVPLSDIWQRAELDRELRQVTASSTGELHLQLGDVRALLNDRLVGRPNRANFRTGGLTVCTMVPMRSVPHRVIALLGLDDGSFPRGSAVDGDDVLARRPLTGERDTRSEDRQLLLDAICAATDTLVVTYTGADPQTGASRPPAVPLGELIDAARATIGLPITDDNDPVRPAGTAPVRHHPLQAFDAQNLQAGDSPPAPDLPFSFDPTALDAARAARTPHPAPGPGIILTGPLPAAEVRDLDLAELIAFFDNPARAFLRGRLGVGLPLEDEPPSDAIPIELDNLEHWAVGDRALAELLAGRSPSQIVDAERLRGTLPPRELGTAVLNDVGPIGEAIAGATAAVRREIGAPSGDPVRAVDVALDLPDGRRLTGTVGQVLGRTHLVTTYSTQRAKQRLHLWIALLALTAGAEPGPWQAVGVGRRGRGAGLVRVGTIAPDDARAALLDLIAVHDMGRREPLPLFPATSYEYATKLGTNPRSGVRADELAGRAWEGGRFADDAGERAEKWIARVHGRHVPYAAVTAAPPSAETWPGMPRRYAEVVPHRLGQLALRVWLPAIEAGVTS